ncbi:hypothetical protein [Burkholderia ubonensis]|nr:hypothetical protein [Burkholderia ubonensis]
MNFAADAIDWYEIDHFSVALAVAALVITTVINAQMAAVNLTRADVCAPT